MAGRPRLPQTSAVADLVQSVKQHKNFKQLASYSVQCLAKAIQPPSVGWEARMKEAFQAGALEAITQVCLCVKHSSMRARTGAAASPLSPCPVLPPVCV